MNCRHVKPKRIPTVYLLDCRNANLQAMDQLNTLFSDSLGYVRKWMVPRTHAMLHQKSKRDIPLVASMDYESQQNGPISVAERSNSTVLLLNALPIRLMKLGPRRRFATHSLAAALP